jgi:putative NADH-flavin reductase
MKISVIGASQGTGALTVGLALGRGHTVTAFARNPQRLALSHPSLVRLPGSFHDADAVDAAVVGQDAVIVTASSTNLRGFKDNPTYFSQGTAHVIASMQRHAVRRLVVLSAFGVGESRALAGFLVRRLVIDGFLCLPYADHERQEQLVRASQLDWVIVRPTRLTNRPARGVYKRATAIESVPGSIARADVATFLVEAVEGDRWVRQAVQLGG